MPKKHNVLPDIQERPKETSFIERFEIAIKDLRSKLRKEKGVNAKKYLKIIYIFDFCRDELIPNSNSRMIDKKWERVEEIFMSFVRRLSKSKSNKEKDVIDRRVKHVWLSSIEYALDQRYSSERFWEELVDLGIGDFFKQVKYEEGRLDEEKTSSSEDVLREVQELGNKLKLTDFKQSDEKTAFVVIGIESKKGLSFHGINRTRHLIKKVLLEMQKEKAYYGDE